MNPIIAEMQNSNKFNEYIKNIKDEIIIAICLLNMYLPYRNYYSRKSK